MSRKTVISVGYNQYGYAAVFEHFYSQQWSKEFDFIHICLDRGEPKIDPPSNVQIYYVQAAGNRIIRKWRLISTIVQIAKKNACGILWLSYFRLSFLVRLLLPGYKIIMEYWSVCVNANRLNRLIKNFLMWFESLFFCHFVSLSKDIVKSLHLPPSTEILPLGSDIHSNTNKLFNTIYLLYVGTQAKQREIHKTLYGVAEFKRKYPDIKLTYDIIGRGDGVSLINQKIAEYHLQDIVIMHGYVSDEDIVTFYDRCNVGVCYTPMTEMYLPQPFTKLYEYGLSGMASISVKLNDSVRRVIPEVGVLCDDNEQSFADALEQIWQNRMQYNSERIRNYFMPYTWENISKQFKNIIESV